MITGHGQESEYHKSTQPDRARNEQAGCDSSITHTDAGIVFGRSGLMRSASIGASYNIPVRASLMQSLQRTHGNRAVQRAHSTRSSSGRVPVQRSVYGGVYAGMEKALGKGHPGLDAHKWMLEGSTKESSKGEGDLAWDYMRTMLGSEQSHVVDYVKSFWGQEPAKEGEEPRGHAYAKQNEAGGVEAGFAGMQGSTDIGGVPIDYKYPYAEGRAGVWDENGARRWGIKGNAGLGRLDINKGGDISGDVGIGTVSVEASAGEDGATLGIGASAIEGSVTIGKFSKERDNEEMLRLGGSVGPSAGARLHWGDSDDDGYREYGFGLDIGFFSGDVKTEDPFRSLAGPTVGQLGSTLMPGKNLTHEALQSLPDISTESVIDSIHDPLGAAMGFFSSGPSVEERMEQLKATAARETLLERNREEIVEKYGKGTFMMMNRGQIPVFSDVQEMEQKRSAAVSQKNIEQMENLWGKEYAARHSTAVRRLGAL